MQKRFGILNIQMYSVGCTTMKKDRVFWFFFKTFLVCCVCAFVGCPSQTEDAEPVSTTVEYSVTTEAVSTTAENVKAPSQVRADPYLYDFTRDGCADRLTVRPVVGAPFEEARILDEKRAQVYFA